MTPSIWLAAALVSAPPGLTITAIDERPPRVVDDGYDARVDELREQVEREPHERSHRFTLVRALIDGGELDEALAAAQAWREVDAYNLVVVRLIGDIYSELGEPARALRTYSAVTELLSEDPEAQRALATVLEAQGDLDNAHARLLVATQLRADDRRLEFELADVELRRGDFDAAAARFVEIAADAGADEKLRYPARQRLAQIYARSRREATSDEARASWTAKIEALGLDGGTQNDIKVYLSWDTDRTDVDLWVTNPRGEKVFYSHSQGAFGGKLYGDVTNGYGPESFTAPTAKAGRYVVEVNYFGSGGAMKEARGEVLIVVNEGREDEQQQVLSYVLPRVGQTVRVAEIEVTR